MVPLKVTKSAVLATTKVPNLKANHNMRAESSRSVLVVLATAKVPNLKANHKGHFPLPLGGDALAFGREEQEAI